MNWKEMLFNIAWYAVLFFLFFMLFHLNSRNDSQLFIWNGLGAIVISLSLVGYKNLTFGGYKRIKRIMLSCIFFIMATGFILIFTKTQWMIAIEMLILTSLALSVAMFPLSLYLNRSLKKQSVAQLMADDAS